VAIRMVLSKKGEEGKAKKKEIKEEEVEQ